jgi:hypothetical protein
VLDVLIVSAVFSSSASVYWGDIDIYIIMALDESFLADLEDLSSDEPDEENEDVAMEEEEDKVITPLSKFDNPIEYSS